MQTGLKVSNPFTFKTSMEIALEVTCGVLSSETRENLKGWLQKVPNNLWSETLTVSSKEKVQLKECINAFKQTETCCWIREDFLQALNDIERQC